MEQKFKLTNQNREYLPEKEIVHLIKEPAMRGDGSPGCSTQPWLCRHQQVN